MIVAQLTDSHLKAGGRPAYGRVDTADFLRRAVARLNAFVPAIDAVIFSGDLADAGTPAEYAAVLDILSALRAPVFAVPGNHDRREALAAAFPRGAVAGQPFRACVEEGGPLRLIGLDSSVAGAPHGEIGAAQLAWLDAVLAARPHHPALVFAHHPPLVSGIRHMDVQNLRDGDALLRLLARHPQVRHLACGHLHRAIETQMHGVAVSVAPSPAHAVALDFDPAAPPGFCLEPPMLRLFRFAAADGALVSHLCFVAAGEGPYPFFHADGSLID